MGVKAIPQPQVTLDGVEVLTNKALTSPTINGTIATTGLTMPAFTAGGDISIGANKIKTTSYLLKEYATLGLQIRNVGDTAFTEILASVVRPQTSIEFGGSPKYLNAWNSDTAYLVLQARDTGAGLVEVARLQGDADPEFKIGNNGNALRGSYAGLLGFFATAPQARPTGVAVTAAGIHAALVTLGLITA